MSENVMEPNLTILPIVVNYLTMERGRSRILEDAQKQVIEARQRSEVALLSLEESYRRYLSRRSKQVDKVKHPQMNTRLLKDITIQDVELSALREFEFNFFPAHALSGNFWLRPQVTITLDPRGIDITYPNSSKENVLTAGLLPKFEMWMKFKPTGTKEWKMQFLLEHHNDLNKAAAFFELLASVDSVIREKLQEATSPKPNVLTP